MSSIQGPFSTLPAQAPIAADPMPYVRPERTPNPSGDGFSRADAAFNDDGSLRPGWVEIQQVPVEGGVYKLIAGFVRIGQPIPEGWEIVPGQDIPTAAPTSPPGSDSREPEAPVSNKPNRLPTIDRLEDLLEQIRQILSQLPSTILDRILNPVRNNGAEPEASTEPIQGWPLRESEIGNKVAYFEAVPFSAQKAPKHDLG
jgi:hypothetical protein